MKNSVEKMYAELARLIPEIKKNPEKWQEFIRTFLDSRPDAEIDPDFKAALQSEIEARIEMNETDNEAPSEPRTWLKWLLPAVGGVAIAALILVPILRPATEIAETQIPDNDAVMPADESSQKFAFGNDGAVQIAQLEESDAFGTLDLKASGGETAPSGRGGGMTSAPAPAMEQGGDAALMDRMIWPPYYGRVNYEYAYTGADLPELAAETTVYRRVKGSGDNILSSDSPFLSRWGLSTVDLTRFANLNLEQVWLKETNTELPYTLYIDLVNKQINMNRDFQLWNREFCIEGPGCTYEPLEASDVPGDNEIIRIARDFLETYGIALDDTTTPYVEKYWEFEQPVQPLMAEDTAAMTIPEFYPDTLSVVFPFVVNGQTVEQEWQGKFGLRVDVDLRNENVASATIPVLQLEASNYATKTAAEIMALAETGGKDGVVYNDPERTVELEIGTPTRELRQSWNYSSEPAQEMFLEVLVFPVEVPEELEENTQFYVPREIVVPLAQNLRR